MKRWLLVPCLTFAALSVAPGVAAAATAPTITSQPDIGLVKEAGEHAQFSAGVEGTPLPTVRWQVAPDRNGPWSNVTVPFTSASVTPNQATTTLGILASTENLGDAYRAVFTNSAGTAISRPAKLVSRMDWMANLGSDIENVPLNELTIPGAHDMGTYGVEAESEVSLDGQASGFVCKELDLQSACVSYARAQDPSKSAAEMLEDGIRYFDLRVCGSTGEPENTFREDWPTYTIHPVTCHGLDGAPLESILYDTRAFALAHPKEVVILDVNHEFQVELYELAEQIEKAFALGGGKSLMIAPQYCEAGNQDSGQCASNLTLGKIWHGHLGNVIVNFENDGAPGETKTETNLEANTGNSVETQFHIQPPPNYTFYDSFPNLWGRFNGAPEGTEFCTKSSGTTSCFANASYREEADAKVKEELKERPGDTRHFFIQFLQTTPSPDYIKFEHPFGSLKDMAVSPELGSNPIIGPAVFGCVSGPGSCFAERRPENVNILALNFYNRTDFPEVDFPYSQSEISNCYFGNGPCDLTTAQRNTQVCFADPGTPLDTYCYYVEAVKFDLVEEGIRFNEYARTPPVVEVNAQTPPGGNGWYNATTLGNGSQLVFGVSTHDYRYPTGLTALGCVDGSSQLLPASITPMGETSESEGFHLSDGVHSITCQATDGANEGFRRAGNSGAGPGSNASAVFKIDTHAPTASPTQTPAANGPGWNRGNVTVNWNWKDPVGGSGIEPANCTTSSTSSGEGTITLNATCQDVAGNTGTASYTVKVDKIAPTASPTQVPAANGAGWNRANVTVNWNWTDKGGSGIEPANCTTSSTSAGEGTITLNASCQDVAGNTGTASYTVKVDKMPPTAAPTALPPANGAGWNRANVTVNWNWTDKGGSGIEPSNCTTASTSSGEGTITLNATCQDVAGNTGTASYTVKVDKIAPTVTYTGNAGTYSLLAAVAITCAPSDSLSGVASSTCANTSGPAWSFGAGSHMLSATATDVAGNVGSGSATFTVTVSSADLCTLTRQFVDGTAKYQALASLSRTVIDTTVGLDCVPLTLINSKLSAAAKQPLIATYKLSLQALALGGWLTSAQVTILGNLAGAL